MGGINRYKENAITKMQNTQTQSGKKKPAIKNTLML